MSYAPGYGILKGAMRKLAVVAFAILHCTFTFTFAFACVPLPSVACELWLSQRIDLLSIRPVESGV